MICLSPGPPPPQPPPGTASERKRIVLIRHGRTYMNERLAEPGSRWGDRGFTDVFDDDALFRDSPLSPTGEAQARSLSAWLGEALGGAECMTTDAGTKDAGGSLPLPLPPPPSDEDREALRDIGLVVCSPLTRACRTAELALLPHLDLGPSPAGAGAGVPAIALPLASERLYLVSDLGRPASELGEAFPWIDFGPCGGEGGDGDGDPPSPWWYIHPDGEEYVEWRPSGEGQEYGCRGEPEGRFALRMAALHDWLGSRTERTVALVCHWGLIDWLTGGDFANCELRVVGFDELRRTGPGVEGDGGADHRAA